MYLIKNVFSLLLGACLVIWLIFKLHQSDLLAQVGQLSLGNHAISFLFLLASFAVSGIQMRSVLQKAAHVRLSWMDTLALPITQNFWGYVIPVQGSFIYGTAFLKAKYGANVSSTMSVHLFIMLCSLFIGACFGIVHSVSQDGQYLVVYIVLGLLPVWLALAHGVLKLMGPKSGIMARIHGFTATVVQSVLVMLADPLYVLKVIFMDLCYVALFSGWSYHLSESLDLGVPFFVWVLVSFFVKLTIVAKFTPGNVGVVQFFTGGVLAAYGYPVASGLLISTLQLGLLVVLVFPVAMVLSIFQFKYIRSIFDK